MDIKDFAKNENKKQQKNEKIDLKNENLQKVNEKYGDIVQEFLKRYGKMDEKQMIGEMLKLINQKKAEGTFDAKQIREAATYIAPLLNDNQRAYMYSLLNFID